MLEKVLPVAVILSLVQKKIHKDLVTVLTRRLEQMVQGQGKKNNNFFSKQNYENNKVVTKEKTNGCGSQIKDEKKIPPVVPKVAPKAGVQQDTKEVDTFQLDMASNLCNKIVAAEQARRMKVVEAKLKQKLQELEQYIYKFCNKNKNNNRAWLSLTKGRECFYYHPATKLLFPDLKQKDKYYILDSYQSFVEAIFSRHNKMGLRNGNLPTKEKLWQIIDEKLDYLDNLFGKGIFDYDHFVVVDQHYEPIRLDYDGATMSLDSGYNKPAIPCLTIPNIALEMKYWVEQGWQVEEFAEGGNFFRGEQNFYTLWQEIQQLLGASLAKVIGASGVETLQLEINLPKQEDRFLKALGGNLPLYTEKNIRAELRESKVLSNITPELEQLISEELLASDYNRCNLRKYDKTLLTEETKGHWELWEEPVGAQGKISVQLKQPLVARNPASRGVINEDCLVAIDFGTKSTVVAIHDETSQVLVQRIGHGNIDKKVTKKDYENPTVMNFIDYNTFFRTYKERPARPATRWDWLTVSHDASEALQNSASNNVGAFLWELKQWAGNRSKKLRIKDQKKYNVGILPDFLDLKEGDFNPIEVYAYYIGLYLNNMNNGIYLKYVMSFPVKYELAVREQLVKSFERGIKKSLPLPVQQNPELMRKFQVKTGISEPAAYAVCALRSEQLLPENGEKVFYGVFDFGGGTTDFDFGICRESDEEKEEEEDLDYVVESFGAGGDEYLGGENLLAYLAYEIFLRNKDVMLANECRIREPLEPKHSPCAETIMIDNNSQAALLNIRTLEGVLREFWESDKLETYYEKTMETTNAAKGNPGAREKLNSAKGSKFRTDKKSLGLIGGRDERAVTVEITIDYNVVSNLLEKRIARGVENFFNNLRLAYQRPETEQVEDVHIFLAGNSSKSPYVEKLFLEKIEEFVQTSAKQGKNHQDLAIKRTIAKDQFKLHAPLAMKEVKQKKAVDYMTTPTGKTGVVFGLLWGRGKTAVIRKDNTADNETKFRFYLGNEKKGLFKVVLDFTASYGQWIRLRSGLRPEFELFYSDEARVSTGLVPIEEVKQKKLELLAEHKGASVFIRAVKPTVMEYAVAVSEEAAVKGDFLEKPVAIELGNRGR